MWTTLGFAKLAAATRGYHPRIAKYAYDAIVEKGLLKAVELRDDVYYEPTGLYRLLEDLGPWEMWRLVQ